MHVLIKNTVKVLLWNIIMILKTVSVQLEYTLFDIP